MKKQILLLMVLMGRPLLGAPEQFRELKDGIGIVATACDSAEVLVRAEGWKFTAADFIKKGYRPVRVRIENKSDKVISMSEASVQYKDAEVKQLVERFMVRQNLRPLAWMIMGSSFFVATGVSMFMVRLFARAEEKRTPQPAMRPALETANAAAFWASVAGWLYVIISTPFYRSRLCSANERLYTVVAQALHLGPVIVPQGGHAEKIFLIPDEYRGTFAFSIFDEENSGVLTKFYINCE